MTLPATIYTRVSNLEQLAGNGKERQARLCREMVARHGWELAAEINDEGRSAFVGSNRAPGGELYDFEQRAEQGLYRNGHVLVVENLDRISRQGYDAVLPFLQQLTSQGVTIATVDGERVYPAFERVPMAAVIEAVLKSELAREESQKKSLRNASAWAKKVEKARDGDRQAVTSTTPAWIAVDRITRQMTLIPERAAIVREIFQLTIDGYGTPAIARRLNERGEPVWSYRGVRSNNGWTVGYLTKLVLSRAVIGDYLPQRRPRGAVPVSKGFAILDYYPQVIDAATFERAQAARQSRKGASGAWQVTHNNLFSGLATCAHCGGRMKQEVTIRRGQKRNYKNGRYAAREDFSYLKCHNALNRVWDEERDRLRCENRNWIRYESLERAVLNVAMKFAVTRRDAGSGEQFARLRTEIAERQRHVDEKRRQVDNLADSFGRTGSAAVERRLLALEGELAEDQAALRELEKGLAAEPEEVSLEEFEMRLQAVLTSIGSPDEQERADARVRAKQSLRGIITRMVSHDDRVTIVELGGALRLAFNGDGEEVWSGVIQETIYGPDGEPDWHPDAALGDEEA